MFGLVSVHEVALGEAKLLKARAVSKPNVDRTVWPTTRHVC